MVGQLAQGAERAVGELATMEADVLTFRDEMFEKRKKEVLQDFMSARDRARMASPNAGNRDIR